MGVPQHGAPAGHRDVDALALDAARPLPGPRLVQRLGDRRFDVVLDAIDERAHERALVRTDVAHAAQHAGQPPLASEVADPHFLDRLLGGRRLQRRDGRGAKLFQLFLHASDLP
jgi:hypothetical protein